MAESLHCILKTYFHAHQQKYTTEYLICLYKEILTIFITMIYLKT